MRILSRYFLTRFLVWLGVILVVVAAGIAMAEMLLHLDDVVDASGGLPGALRRFGLKISASYPRIVIPIAACAAGFLTVGLAARWLEVTAIKAGGVSPWRVTAPILSAAAALAVVTLFVNETLVIQAERAWRREGREAEGEIQFRRGSFWYHRGNFIYNVRNADPASGTLHQVNVFEMDTEGRLIRRIHARSAKIEGTSWRLRDATIRRFDPADPLGPPSFQRVAETTLEASQTTDPTLLEADAAILSLPNLREYIRARAREGEDTGEIRALFHDRLTDPVIVFLLVLLALPFAVRAEQTKSLAIPALQGLILVLIFWSVRSVGSVFATRGPTEAVVVPWAIVALFALLGSWRLARIPR